MKEPSFLFGNEKRLILIADDEYVNREILGNILEDEYEIIYAKDGREAYELMSLNKDKWLMNL